MRDGDKNLFDNSLSSYLATVFLGEGTYDIAVSMVEEAGGMQAPVPPTSALLGAGLLGLGIARHRKTTA